MAARQLQQRVYFIQSGTDGPIKIGVAEDAKVRMRHMQTGCPEQLHLLGTHPGGQERERQYHAFLAEHRERGEWFRPTAEVLAAVPGGDDASALQRALGGCTREEAMNFRFERALMFARQRS
jgi:hypothetical protein